MYKNMVSLIILILILSVILQVRTAACGCVGGSPPAACKHSLALLYAILNYSQKELYCAPTEQLQKWHQVKPTKTSPKKFDYDTEDESVLDDVNYECLNDLHFTAPIFDVIDNTNFNLDEASYRKSVPLPVIVCTSINHCDYPEYLNFNELMFLHENIKVSFEEAVTIEKDTIQQSKCNAWKMERLKRLTSSLFFKIIKCKSNFTNLANEIHNSHNNNISDIPAVKYGILNEPLVQNVLRHTYNNFVFRKTGLIINPFFPYLGASPDGLLHNSDETILIEIKCIYNPHKLNLSGLVQSRTQFCLKFENEKFSLKSNHKYMYQIQGQLAVSNLTKCLFVLMYRQNMPLYIEEIKFDHQLWLSMKNRLHNFYFKYYLPIVIN